MAGQVDVLHTCHAGGAQVADGGSGVVDDGQRVVLQADVEGVVATLLHVALVEVALLTDCLAGSLIGAYALDKVVENLRGSLFHILHFDGSEVGLVGLSQVEGRCAHCQCGNTRAE